MNCGVFVAMLWLLLQVTGNVCAAVKGVPSNSAVLPAGLVATLMVQGAPTPDVEISQAPRPCVAAARICSDLFNEIWNTWTFGKPPPKRLQVLPPFELM